MAAMTAERTNEGRNCWEGARNLQQRKEKKTGEQTWHESRKKGERGRSDFRRGAELFFHLTAQ
jgi:hypothetical protein